MADDAVKTGEGVVKWYNPTKGFGFITPDDGGGDIFVRPESARSIRQKNPGVDRPDKAQAAGESHKIDIREGQRVSFETQNSETGRATAYGVQALKDL